MPMVAIRTVRCHDGRMSENTASAASDDAQSRVVTASREINAPAVRIFELIADPSQQPRWDGNDNLREAAEGQRVHAVGDVFAMTLTKGKVRENHVVAFEEGREIAWMPASEGEQPAGHRWGWRLTPLADDVTVVEHIYDWSQLTDESRFERARSTTAEMLMASIERLAELAESGGAGHLDPDGGTGTVA